MPYSLLKRMLSQGTSFSPPNLEAQLEFGLNYSQLERSEEHTSELQSLMRISYAVFCLKKKNNKKKPKQSKKQTNIEIREMIYTNRAKPIRSARRTHNHT